MSFFRRYWKLLLLALVAYGVYLADVERRSALGRAARAATGLEAYETIEAALPEAQTAGKPLLVEVSAVW